MRALPGLLRCFASRRRLARKAPRFQFRGEVLEPRVVLSVGGGSTAAGLLGAYYPNTTLSGDPAFTRTDVRIDFDWGGTESPGGSTAPAYSTIETNNFSVRWTGQVIPRFSESYTFSTLTTGGVRFYIKAESTGTWTQLISDWANHESTQTDTGQFALVAGQTYDIKLEYFAAQGSPRAILKWSSPSTPQEILDPLSVSGLNVIPYSLPPLTFADAIRQGREQWAPLQGSGTVAKDENGWPLADAKNILWEGEYGPTMVGTYFLQFQGTAAVTAWRTGIWVVGSNTYTNTLPKGAGYNPETNTTTAKLILNTNVHDIFSLSFASSQRTSASPVNSGVTEVHLMRPTSVGATSSYPVGQVYCDQFIEAIQPYVVLRAGTSINGNEEADWSDRTLPNYHTAIRDGISMAWEDLVMLSNESGKDLYVLLPMNATDDYISKLARLIRFGSDGVNPYSSAQANPVYPGLNSNLRVYVEWSNETWNWSFTQGPEGVRLAREAVEQNTPNGQIINYDGTAPAGNYQRWTALRTVQTSDIFRGIWGDAAMGDAVRILLEYQYDNGQGTAAGELSFIDNYFNNVDGQHVAQPHPVSYYIWGAGGAAYYNASNEQGLQSEIVLADHSLEATTLSPGSVLPNPPSSAWSFSGTAGILSDTAKVSPAVTATPGTLLNTLSTPSALGYSFTVGSSDVALYALGRYVVSGNNQTHRLHLIRASDRVDLASIQVNAATGTAGQYIYGAIAVPVILQAGQTYYVVSEEINGRDSFYSQDTSLIPNPGSGVTVNGSVSATYNGATGNTRAWTYTLGTAAYHTYGPVDVILATRGTGTFGFVPDSPDGSQSLYLTGTGSVRQTLSFSSTGVFAVQFEAAAMDGLENSIDLYVDGNRITPRTYDSSNYLVSSSPFLPGRSWGRDYHKYQAYGSIPFTITSTGVHTIEIIGRGTADQTLFLDDIQLTSMDAIEESTIPVYKTTGSYQAQLISQARYALSYGLNVVAYEGGWALGGDAGSTPLQNYAKYMDPRTAEANRASIDAFSKAGGEIYAFGSYNQWLFADTSNAVDYPLVQGVAASNETLPEEPVNGTAVPGSLDQTQVTWSMNIRRNALTVGSWQSWNILVPASGNYQIASTGAAGGTLAILADGTTTIATGPSNSRVSGTTYFTAGLHTIMVRALSGSFAGPQLTVSHAYEESSTTVAFLGADSTTKGNWKGVYGTDGYHVISNRVRYPSYATVTVSTHSTSIWAKSTTDVRGLQKAGINETDRIASAWNDRSQLSIDISLTDGASHQISIYGLDWDSYTRSQTIEVIDAETGTVLDTQTLRSFHDGIYLSWDVSGHVIFRLTRTGGANAVLSGLFFGAATNDASASIVKTDTTTQGNWKGTYGVNGYSLIGNRQSYPSYASVTTTGSSAVVWEGVTNDVRALQKAEASKSERIASAYYSATQFGIDINLTDGQSRNISLYALDWNSNARSEIIEVIDARTGAVLDSRRISSFRNGVYLTWNVRGHVIFQITRTGGANAVVSGLFFD